MGKPKFGIQRYEKMMEILLFSLLIIAICMLFLCVRLFFGRRFVNSHVDGNPALRRRGIRCVQSMEAAERRPNPHRVREKRDKSPIVHKS